MVGVCIGAGTSDIVAEEVMALLVGVNFEGVVVIGVMDSSKMGDLTSDVSSPSLQAIMVRLGVSVVDTANSVNLLISPTYSNPF